MKPWAERVAPVTGLLVCCAPLFVMAMRSWPTVILFAGSLLCAALVLWGGLPRPGLAPGDRTWVRAMVVAMTAPIVAVVLAAWLRGDPYLPQFDAPLRFLLGIPVFLFMLRARLHVARAFRLVLPLALIAALWSLEFVGRAERFPVGRDTTTVVDPLVFGYLSLAFALMCLVSIAPGDWRRRPWSVLWRGAAVLLGIYLSLRSGSRTGWAAMPLVAGTWLYLHWGRGHPARSAIVLLAICLAPVAAFLMVPTVHERLLEAWREVAAYPWAGVAPDTSVGLRITFLRVAADTFVLRPWSGMGDTGRFPTHMLPSFAYASPAALEGAFHAHFHNQVVSNAVRSGIGGLAATLLLLLVPLAICIRQLRHTSPVTREIAFMGFAYTLCMFVSSLSTEVVDLKSLASLYAVMTAVLCGAALAPREEAPQS